MIAVATAIPSGLLGTTETNFAATGAIRTPPRARPPTADQSISMREILARKPMLAQTATINSAALTVPMIFLGSCSVVASRVGVTIGPQPPPPDASIKPPVAPRNVRYLGLLS